MFKLKRFENILNVNKRQKSLLKIFIVFTFVSFICFASLSFFSVKKSLGDSLDLFEMKLRNSELNLVEKNFDNYISSRIRVLKDLAAYPIVVKTVMNSDSGSAYLKDFLSDTMVLGDKLPVNLYDIWGRKLVSSDKQFKIELNENIFSEISNNDFKLNFVNRELVNYLHLIVPVVYGKSIEGFIAIELDFYSIFGASQEEGLSFAIKYGEELYTSTKFLDLNWKEFEVYSDKYNLDILFKAETINFNHYSSKLIQNLFQAILLSSVLSSIIIFLLGKNLFIEPFNKLAISERNLKELTDRFNLTLKAAHVGAWFWDFRSNEVIWDERMFEIYGVQDSTQIVDYTYFSKHVHPDDIEPLNEYIDDCILNRENFNTDFRIIREADLEVRHISAIGEFGFDEKNNVINLRGINFDITDKKNSQLLIEKKTLELESSNQELERFAFVVSHDLQEPLRTIANYVDLLKLKLGEKLEDKEEVYMNYIIDSTLRLKSLIKDILLCSRIGKSDEKSKLNLNLLLCEIIESLSLIISEKNAYVKLVELPSIYANKFEITQLFQNLITNSLKFSNPDKDTLITIKYDELESKHQFSIEDNGIGMNEDDLENIFEMFRRLNPHELYSGNGIGLTNVKKIVENYKGDISVSSEPGIGTKFVFTIEK
ncbi:MAG: ATP-binding protein [Candidatus Caenarcaniphilales bacterium]|nr:ATP-binding protein [Candidatus Caenarcaniphilales bacterium]